MKKLEDLKPGIPEFNMEKMMRTNPGNYLGSKHIRMVRFNKVIKGETVKEKFWYSPLADKQALMILFHGYQDGVLYSCPCNSPIRGNHFSVVKRVDKMNNDLRFD